MGVGRAPWSVSSHLFKYLPSFLKQGVCVSNLRIPAPLPHPQTVWCQVTHPCPSCEEEATTFSLLPCVSGCSWQAVWSPVALSCRCPLSGLRWGPRLQKPVGKMGSFALLAVEPSSR